VPNIPIDSRSKRWQIVVPGSSRADQRSNFCRRREQDKALPERAAPGSTEGDMAIDWGGVWTEIGKSAAIAAAIAGFVTWGTKAVISQFLQRDLEAHKNQLAKDLADHKHASDLVLEQRRNDLKRESDIMLADIDRRTQEALAAQKAASDRITEAFKSELGQAASREERIRQEVERWANPILDAVRGLQNRLENILHNDGYRALSTSPRKPIPAGWSITYEYIFPSTIFLLAQYFCSVRLLQEQLRFELFREHEEKDDFLECLQSVSQTLSSWPLKELRDPRPANDLQVFTQQQRAMGEAMVSGEGDAAHCIGLSDFLKKWVEDDAFKRQFAPLAAMVDGLEPNTARWQRFQLMHKALAQAEQKCESILRPGKRASSA
jgi:hypothetical protein